MPDRLGQGRLLPAAKPVGSFITPAQIEAQRPAAPSRLQASNYAIGLQATAAKPNVAGYNPGEQLGEALSKFSTTLTTTLQGGLELYASDQYQKGQNEVAKAMALAERQMDQSSVEYADANKQLARVDPISALAMDQTNPFRYAGRQKALSQIAAGEIGGALMQSYRQSAGDLALLDPGDPRINEVKAQAVNQIIQKFGLDTSKSGFAESFLPALNRGWERVTAQQIEDRNAYLKDTVWRGAGVAIGQLFRQYRQEGKDLGQAAQMAGALLDQEARRLGLPGEATDMKQKAITLARQSLLNAGETDAARALLGIPVGPADETGYRQTAAQMYQLDLMEDDDKYGEIRRRAQDRELEPVRDALEAEVGAIGLQVEDGPQKLQALQAIINDPRFQALPLGERLEIIGKANKLGEEILGQGFSQEAGPSFIAELDREFGFGSQRDFAAAEARLEEILQQVPQEDRGRIRQQFADWKNRQQKQPWDLINPAIANKIKANLAQHYPDLGVAALRGINNIEGILQWGDAASKESAARQLAGYRTHVLTRLDEERTRLGRDLSDSEALGVINKALAEYGTKDQDARDYMFPKVPGAPGSRPQAQPTPPPGRKPSPVQGTAPTLMDNMADRQSRLQQWKNQPLLTMDATRDLTLDVLNGGSFPAAFRRAAKDAGTTPEQLLIRQLDFYPNGLKLNTQQRNQILKQGNQAQALDNNRQQRGNIDVAALVRSAGSWMLDAALGIQPAMARNSDLDLIRRYSGGGGAPSNYQSRDPRGQALIAMAARNGWDAADLAAVFSFETGGTLSPGEPGRGAAAGRIGLIQAGSQERADYGLGSGNWNQEMLGVERYLKARGFKAGMNLADLYATVNGGNPRAGYTPDGNRVVARSESTQRALRQHRQQAMARLGLSSAAPTPSPRSAAPAQVPAGWRPARGVASASGFGASESFRNGKGHEGMDLSFNQGTPLAFSVGGEVLKVYRTNSTAREANGGYGNYMDIRLANGRIVRMAHLSQIPQGVATGTRFRPGQSIALSGGQVGTPGAGRSTNAHLHFEEHAAPGMGAEETTRGKLNPGRRGGALDYLIWRGS